MNFRVEFGLVSANEDIGKDYGLITFFDCLHDMGDPVGALSSQDNRSNQMALV